MQSFLDCVLRDICPPPVDTDKSRLGFDESPRPHDKPMPSSDECSVKNKATPQTGTFTLHGRPIDVLSDGKVLIYLRARTYDPKHGRWLQRDPKGYVDGGNLYEAFGGNTSRKTDPYGNWTEEGLIDCFIKEYGDNPMVLYAALEILQRYRLKQGTALWFNDYWVCHESRQIFIADDNCGMVRSDENAAYQLYRILAEDFYGVTNLEETWEGWTWRMVEATGKTVGGGLAAVGGGLLVIAPEPSGVTKVGGVGAVLFGTNTLLDGWTQFGQREGGTNLAGIAADEFQKAVQGELPGEWYLRSRTYVMLGGTAFELVGTGGFSKFLRTTPVRELPSATKAALTRGYQKLATKLGAKGAPTRGGYRLGQAASRDYRSTFFRANPELQGEVVVHHGIEQQVLTRYPGRFTEAEIHSIENLRGIPKVANPDLHLSKIRWEWNAFYRQFPNATREQILQKAGDIDAMFGSRFMPPVGG